MFNRQSQDSLQKSNSDLVGKPGTDLATLCHSIATHNHYYNLIKQYF